jgi:NAD(P)-dependent dehydrogenase (short-subunit alcohol dehydrogenase family)
MISNPDGVLGDDQNGTDRKSPDPLVQVPTLRRGIRRVVVTGGADFLGSHLCESLLRRGDEVICVDDLFTGERDHVTSLLTWPLFTFVEADVSLPAQGDGTVDAVAHPASAASPPDYDRRLLETLAVGSRGTENALALAKRHGARFVLASASQVYGNPLVHPKHEDYWGNVSPTGPRGAYDEVKRFAEALSTAYARTRHVDAGVMRIFNTYGPRMRPEDGRGVSGFITQASTRFRDGARDHRIDVANRLLSISRGRPDTTSTRHHANCAEVRLASRRRRAGGTRTHRERVPGASRTGDRSGPPVAGAQYKGATLAADEQQAARAATTARLRSTAIAGCADTGARSRSNSPPHRMARVPSARPVRTRQDDRYATHARCPQCARDRPAALLRVDFSNHGSATAMRAPWRFAVRFLAEGVGRWRTIR